MNPHSLSYKFVPKDRRPLCRRIQSLQEHREKCQNTMLRSCVGMKGAVYEVKLTEYNGEKAVVWKDETK